MKYNLCLSFVMALCLVDVASVNSQTRADIPCGPNHTVPSGYVSCKDSDGNTWVAPPPSKGSRTGGVFVPPPGVRVAPPTGGVVVAPPPPAPRPDRPVTPRPTTPVDRPEDKNVADPNQSPEPFWKSPGWLTAIAAVITALLGGIAALRKRSSE